MNGYKAIVVGENFEFVVDNEPQQLEFFSEVYVNAADENAAQAAALAMIREELLSQSLLDEAADQYIAVDEISQTEVLADKPFTGDFIWLFPDEDLLDEGD